MIVTKKLNNKSIEIYKLFGRRVPLNRFEACFSNYSTNSSDSNKEDSKKSENHLYRYLYAKIKSCGPITVADYMQEVLTHPTAGYYMNKDVFGKTGDFTTSPEITQLFGEMIAVWMTYERRKISKEPFQIVELGPGRGTLMKDILRVFKQFGMLKDVSVHLVEISPILSSIQAKNLCKTSKEYGVRKTKSEENNGHYREGVTEDGVNVYWYHSILDLPKQFSIFLAHEFFDALPIHKFQKTDRGWNEVLVDIIEGSNKEKFRYVLSNSTTPAAAVYISDTEKREHLEISPQSLVIIDHIANYLWECGGFALICDYGHNGEKTDTFRAFSQHKLHDPLESPGTADLTADVDFTAIKKVAENNDRLIVFGPVTQATFLRNLGIDVRLFMLLQNMSKEERKNLESEYHMIMDDDKMGERFKFISLFPKVLKEYFDKKIIPLVTGFHDKYQR